MSALTKDTLNGFYDATVGDFIRLVLITLIPFEVLKVLILEPVSEPFKNLYNSYSSKKVGGLTYFKFACLSGSYYIANENKYVIRTHKNLFYIRIGKLDFSTRVRKIL